VQSPLHPADEYKGQLRKFFGFSRRQFAAFSPEFNTILLIASYFEENNHFPSHTYGLGMTTDQLYS
jgi:hypothetical protein